MDDAEEACIFDACICHARSVDVADMGQILVASYVYLQSACCGVFRHEQAVEQVRCQENHVHNGLIILDFCIKLVIREGWGDNIHRPICLTISWQLEILGQRHLDGQTS